MGFASRAVSHPAPKAGFALVRMLVFWTVFGLAEALGALGGLIGGAEYDPKWFMHDVEVYPLLPTAAQARTMLARWQALVPTPVFDVAYSWGSQRADTALENTPDLRKVFRRHNASGALP